MRFVINFLSIIRVQNYSISVSSKRNFLGKPETTKSYELSINFWIKCGDKFALHATLFQCFLFMWNAPVMAFGYSSRSSMARCGSHFAENPVKLSISHIANIFPITLNTRADGPKGSDSSAPFLERQYVRNASIFMTFQVYIKWVYSGKHHFRMVQFAD